MSLFFRIFGFSLMLCAIRCDGSCFSCPLLFSFCAFPFPFRFLFFFLVFRFAAPTILSLVAANGASATAYAAGDTITVTFSRATNQANLLSPLDTAGVNSLFSFSQSIGTAYSGNWSSPSVFVITCDSPDSAAPKIGSLIVTPIHPNLRDAQSISPVISSASPALSGTFVNVSGSLSFF